MQLMKPNPELPEEVQPPKPDPQMEAALAQARGFHEQVAAANGGWPYDRRTRRRHESMVRKLLEKAPQPVVAGGA